MSAMKANPTNKSELVTADLATVGAAAQAPGAGEPPQAEIENEAESYYGFRKLTRLQLRQHIDDDRPDGYKLVHIMRHCRAWHK
jgi:hypothetical protein